MSRKLGCAVLIAASNQGVLFQIMVSMSRVEATYAPPVKPCGAVPTRSHRWVVTDDVSGAAREIREFFGEA